MKTIIKTIVLFATIFMMLSAKGCDGKHDNTMNTIPSADTLDTIKYNIVPCAVYGQVDIINKTDVTKTFRSYLVVNEETGNDYIVGLDEAVYTGDTINGYTAKFYNVVPTQYVIGFPMFGDSHYLYGIDSPNFTWISFNVISFKGDDDEYYFWTMNPYKNRGYSFNVDTSRVISIDDF